MSVSRDRLAPGQSRVSTASAFGRIGWLAVAAVLTVPANPETTDGNTRPSFEAAHQLACLGLDQQAGRCQSGPAIAVSRPG